MAADLIVDLNSRFVPASIGTKAINLRWLMHAGFKVPITLVCRWEAYQLYQTDSEKLADQVKNELTRKILPDRVYAVRSSANLEDCPDQSFAGQFNSILSVSGVDSILQSVRSVWDLAKSKRVKTYLQKYNLDDSNLKMAVLIQEMVKPIVSGVAFSRNPVTGANEVVVEAVAGSGDNFLSAGDTPLRWIFANGNWASFPEGELIPLGMIAQVVKETIRIAGLRKKAVDLEWVFDGQTIYWVQLREITSFGQTKVYSNTIAKDMLPGMIKPLIWSVNIPMVGQTWVQLLTEMLGKNDIDSGNLVKAFYYRTYFEMGTFGRIFNLLGLPEETLELMMGLREARKKMPMFRPNLRTFRLLPRILRFVVAKAHFAPKVEAFLPRMQSSYQNLYIQDASKLDDAEILARINRLTELTGETAYYNIVVPLLMQIYNAVLRRNVIETGEDFTSLDLLEGMDQLHEYDPGFYLIQLHEIFSKLPPAFQTIISNGDMVALQQTPDLENFRSSFQAFIKRFGHLSDSGNDFSVQPWREQPAELLKMVACFQQPPAKKLTLHYHQVRFPWWKRPMLNNIYKRARSFRMYREQISSLYTYGYGLLRVYFMALGIHFAGRGILTSIEDIFYLTLTEVQALVGDGSNDTHYADIAGQRKKEMERCRSFIPPETIYGDQIPPVNISISQHLRGTPTSRGCYTGKVKVVRSLADFSNMHPGAVLVIPYSDVGWTPLFLQAGGVISESGGMLSHSSIIAREYGIPAVVSVPNATQLPDGIMVTVDGFLGEVLVHLDE